MSHFREQPTWKSLFLYYIIHPIFPFWVGYFPPSSFRLLLPCPFLLPSTLNPLAPKLQCTFSFIACTSNTNHYIASFSLHFQKGFSFFLPTYLRNSSPFSNLFLIFFSISLKAFSLLLFFGVSCIFIYSSWLEKILKFGEGKPFFIFQGNKEKKKNKQITRVGPFILRHFFIHKRQFLFHFIFSLIFFAEKWRGWNCEGRLGHLKRLRQSKTFQRFNSCWIFHVVFVSRICVSSYSFDS